MNRILTKTMISGAAVLPRRIVKLNGSGRPVQSTAAADLHVGVCDTVGVDAAGERVDIVFDGLPDVDAGAAIAAGASVTADADGKAVTAATDDLAVGWAYTSADAEDDIIQIKPGRHIAP